MSAVHAILELVAGTSSKKEKEELLKRYHSNIELQAFFVNALSPMVRFHIKKIPTYKSPKHPTLSLMHAMSDILPQFSTRKVTGNAATALLKETLERLHPDDANVFERIIKKDPRIGAQVSTVNKVWPKLIPEFPVMLASAHDIKLLKALPERFIVQLKADGKRFTAFANVDEQKVTYFTRNGKEMDLKNPALDANFLKAADILCEAIQDSTSWVFDGELLVKIKGKIAERKIGNGILLKAQTDTLSEAEASAIHAMVWDAVPEGFFWRGFWQEPYENRFTELEKSVDGMEMIEAIETHWVNSLEEAGLRYAEYVEAGEEGIIAKDPSMPWEDDRSKQQIKFKAEEECDLECIDWLPGRVGTKNEGLLGALTCKTSDGKLTVNVGGGFSDKQRKTLKPKDVVGQIIAVRYNMKITNASGKYSLFLPRFIEIREDKDTADSLKDIK